jgi:hypothetical protein
MFKNILVVLSNKSNCCKLKRDTEIMPFKLTNHEPGTFYN